MWFLKPAKKTRLPSKTKVGMRYLIASLAAGAAFLIVARTLQLPLHVSWKVAM